MGSACWSSAAALEKTLSSSAKSRLISLQNFALYLRDMKLNFVQFPCSCMALFVREKGPNKLPSCTVQQNLPLGGFAASEPAN